MARSASTPAPRLTTTSYAFLGLLRLQPFSAYELTGYMRVSALSRLWPRAEASLYREPKTLVANGLARARVKHTGRRGRTVYEITAAGRRALEAWLREPGDGLRIECEAAVKAFFGDATDLESLRSHIESLREPWRAWNEGIEEGTTNWLAGRLPFPDRIQYSVLAADLFDRIYQATDEWATDWLERTESWEETGLHEHSEQQARALIEARRDEARRS